MIHETKMKKTLFYEYFKLFAKFTHNFLRYFPQFFLLTAHLILIVVRKDLPSIQGSLIDFRQTILFTFCYWIWYY